MNAHGGFNATLERDVAAETEVEVGGTKSTMAGAWHVLLIRTADGWFALNNRCSHAAARLAGGRVRAGTIMCPRHGARFDLSDGRCVSMDYASIRTFPVRVERGRVIVMVPRTAPDLSEVPIG